MERVAILGLGMMGGSLALALKGRARVTVYARSEAVRTEALRRGLCAEAYADAAAAVRGAGIAVCCLPVCRIPACVRSAASALGPDTVVTDVGSTKEWLMKEMPSALEGSGADFVGSHPLAGSEKTGLGSAREDLYRGALVAVTAGTAAPAAAARVRAFWEGLGARVVAMEAQTHDRLAARISHLPHLAAAMTAACAAREGPLPGVPAGFCGAGFRDTTRVAAGDPSLWRDICATNATALRDELEALRGGLDSLLELFDRRDFDALEDFLAQAAEGRRLLCPDPPAEQAP